MWCVGVSLISRVVSLMMWCGVLKMIWFWFLMVSSVCSVVWCLLVLVGKKFVKVKVVVVVLLVMLSVVMVLFGFGNGSIW